jgi:uncharacterized protein
MHRARRRNIEAPIPLWLYYFNVPDIAVAADSVMAGGDRTVQGPNQLPDVGWTAWWVDPQGAMFALQASVRDTLRHRTTSIAL